MIAAWQLADYERELAALSGQARRLLAEFLARSDPDAPGAFDALVEFAQGLDWHYGDAANLYGTGKSKMLNPQSNRVVVSNVRSSHTIDELTRQAVDVLNGETGFTEAELKCIDEIVIVDRSGAMRRLKK